MCRQVKLGFTLMELMVVILLLSILIAVGGPVYTSYKIKAQFTEVFGIINKYHNDLQLAYTDNEQFPTTFNNISSGAYSTLTSDVLQQVYYATSTNHQAAYLQFFTLDLGASSYVMANSSGLGGVNCRITLAAIATSTGVTRFYCGQWDGSDTDVKLTYLPKACQDTNISALIS